MDDALKQTIEFNVFLIHRLAEHWGKAPSEAHEILSQAGAISEYTIPHYDVLHTLGVEYLVNDLTRYVEKRGVTIS